MMQNNRENPVQEQHIPMQDRGRRTDEAAGLNIDEYVKIFDPETKEVHLEKRA